jgi:hypothetical protein
MASIDPVYSECAEKKMRNLVMGRMPSVEQDKVSQSRGREGLLRKRYGPLKMRQQGGQLEWQRSTAVEGRYDPSRGSTEPSPLRPSQS